VHSWLQVTQHAQPWGVANLDPRAVALFHAPPDEEPLKGRGVHYRHFFKEGKAELSAT